MFDVTSERPGAVNKQVRILKNSDCRAVLEYFRRRSTDVATVDDLTEFVWDRQEAREKSSVEIALHHSALPKLADAGLIEYDARSNTARYRADSSIERWVRRVLEREEALL
jgi:hypothetical protein